MRRQLKAKLAAISVVNSIATGIYTPPIPESARYPLVTIQNPLDDSEHTLAGVSAVRRELWQVDVYADGAGAWMVVDALCDAIRSALDGAIGETWTDLTVLSCWLDDEGDLPENESVAGESGIVRRHLDFIIKYKTS